MARCCNLRADEGDRARPNSPAGAPRRRVHNTNTNETIFANHSPVVIITSETAREMPVALLRRLPRRAIDWKDPK